MNPCDYVCPKCHEPGLPSIFFDLCTACANEKRGFGVRRAGPEAERDVWFSRISPDYGGVEKVERLTRDLAEARKYAADLKRALQHAVAEADGWCDEARGTPCPGDEMVEARRLAAAAVCTRCEAAPATRGGLFCGACRAEMGYEPGAQNTP